MRFSHLWLLVGVVLLACEKAPEPPTWQYEDGGLTLIDAGQPRFHYQVTPKSRDGQYRRANYLHPVWSPTGAVITEDFPEDHPHHRGIFWTWHQVWKDSVRLADPWLCEGIRWEVYDVQRDSLSQWPQLVANVRWWQVDSLGNDLRPMLEEQVTIQYQSLSAQTYQLDITVVLEALFPLALGGSEDEKGYGGFSARWYTEKALNFFSAAEGGKNEILPENTPVAQDQGWIEMHIASAEAETSATTVVMMADTSNLPQWQGWILRSTGSMQNPAFPGASPIQLQPGEPLPFRNRLLISQAPLPLSDIEASWQAFLAQAD